MGARPSSFKKGGGFLNGVDARIVDYQFTDEFNGEPFKPGKDPKTKKDRFHALNFFLTVKVDGADDTINTTLFGGGFEDFEVSNDGHVLTNPEGGECTLGAGTAVGRLLNSLIVAGFDENEFSDDPNSVDLTPIIGKRVRFVQRTNVEDTKRLGKRKGKDGKEYDRQDLVIDQYYAEAASASSSKSGSTKGAAASKGAGKGNTKKAAEVDIKVLSGETLIAILEDSDGKITKQKLGVKVLLRLKGNDAREDVRKFLFDDSNLTEFADEGVEVDGDTKAIEFNKAKGVIELA